MKIIRVQYTVKSDFVEANKQNIARVMEELRQTGNVDVKYFALLHEDGKTFMHVVMYNSTEAESFPASLESFKTFQAELKENVEVPPKTETFSLVDSSFDTFNAKSA
jgi:hypothetical protein